MSDPRGAVRGTGEGVSERGGQGHAILQAPHESHAHLGGLGGEDVLCPSSPRATWRVSSPRCPGSTTRVTS